VASNPALTTPLGVYGCTFAYSQNCIVATTSGQVVENGNVFMGCSTALTSISPGAHSVSTACPAFSLHDERIFGGNPRPWGEPSEVSPIIAAGNYGTPPSVDAWGRDRPAKPSSGPLERDEFEIPTVINNYIFQVEG
jgi:hypothetical protein